MGLRDLVSQYQMTQSIVPQSATAAVNGSSADLSGDAAAAVFFNLGTTVGTGVLLIQDSPDDSVWSTVVAADMVGGAFTAITTANDNAMVMRGYIGSQRYIRAQLVSIGTSLLISAFILRLPRGVAATVVYGA